MHETDNILWYEQADSPDGTSWGSNIWIDDTYGAGWNISMADVAGYPGVAYIQNAYSVKFSRALDLDGDNWSLPVEFDAGSVNGDCSLCMVSGTPAIAYYDNVLGALKLIRAQAEDGSAWELPVIVDIVGETGSFGHQSMAMLGTSPAYPAIVFGDYENGKVLFYRADSIDGTSWLEPFALFDDATFDVNEVSFAVVDGVPCAAYKVYDTVNYVNHLYFRYAWDPAGTSWSSAKEITTNALSNLRLIDANGRPAISYYVWAGPDTGMWYAYSPPNP